DEVTGERARLRDVVASSPDLEDLQRANQGVGARNGAQIGRSTPGDARGQQRERDELQGADKSLRPIVVSIEACRVEDLADPGPPRRHEQQRRLTDAPPARMGHDEQADLPDDDHEGQVIKQFEPRRRAMSTLARAELRTPRPASMGTTARPRHHSITVIVLLQLDDPLTWPDASAGYFLGSFSLRSDWAARSLTKLRSAMSQIRPGQRRHSLSRLKIAVRLAPSVERYAGRSAGHEALSTGSVQQQSTATPPDSCKHELASTPCASWDDGQTPSGALVRDEEAVPDRRGCSRAPTVAGGQAIEIPAGPGIPRWQVGGATDFPS